MLPHLVSNKHGLNEESCGLELRKSMKWKPRRSVEAAEVVLIHSQKVRKSYMVCFSRPASIESFTSHEIDLKRLT